MSFFNNTHANFTSINGINYNTNLFSYVYNKMLLMITYHYNILLNLFYNNKQVTYYTNFISGFITNFISGFITIFNTGFITDSSPFMIFLYCCFLLFCGFNLYILLKFCKSSSYIDFFLSLPIFGKHIKKKLYTSSNELQESFHKSYKNLTTIPEDNIEEDELFNKIKTMNNEFIKKLENGTINNNKISGVVYHGGQKHIDKLVDVFYEFAISNPLHPDLFPAIRNMEIDIINMVGSLFKGGKECCGNVTYGGTESILLACLTYRDYFKYKYGITNPNIVAFDSVHPAFEKAGHYFNIKIRKIKIKNYYQWTSYSSEKVCSIIKSFVDSNTILLVGSAPSYPHGLVDSIVEIGKVAAERNIGFHVDACMGGFLIPFLDRFKYINFELPGVTSISVDTHKYGYSLKGSSVLLFKNPQIKKFQHYINKNWSGGVYATPTLMGSKSGGIIASTWASLLYIGYNNYKEYATNIQENLIFIINKLQQNSIFYKNVSIIGNPQLNIIAFKSANPKLFDIFLLIQEMKQIGWDLSILHKPAAFHFCLTHLHTREICEEFCKNMISCINNVLNMENTELTGTLALYGASSSIQGNMFVDEIIHDYLYLLSREEISSRYT